MATIKVTADGEIDIMTSKNNASTFNVNGSFGGGTLAFGYRNEAGTFSAYATNGSLTGPGELVIDAGRDVKLMVSMTGSTTPDVNIEHHGHYDG